MGHCEEENEENQGEEFDEMLLRAFRMELMGEKLEFREVIVKEIRTLDDVSKSPTKSDNGTSTTGL